MAKLGWDRQKLLPLLAGDAPADALGSADRGAGCDNVEGTDAARGMFMW